MLGVAYARLRFGDHALTGGRHVAAIRWNLDGIYRFYNRYDGAFIGRRDVRAMIPLLVPGRTVAGKVASDTVRYYGGCVNKMKQINDTRFQGSRGGGVPARATPTACRYGGAQWKINNNMMLQGGYNRADNLLDMGWVDLDMVHRFDKDRYVRLESQYIYQTANGKQESRRLLHEQQGRLRRSALGAVVDTVRRFGMELAMGKSCARRYSLGPSYLVQRIGENAKAGEQTSSSARLSTSRPWARAASPST